MDFAADCAYEKPKNFHKREFGLHLATIVVPDIPIYSAKTATLFSQGRFYSIYEMLNDLW